MDLIIFTLIIPFAAIAGIIISKLIFKTKAKVEENKLIEDAKKVLSGEKENNFDLDGKKIEVNKFIVKDDDDNEVALTFGKGGIKQEKIKGSKEIKFQNTVSIEDKKIEDKKIKKKGRKRGRKK